MSALPGAPAHVGGQSNGPGTGPPSADGRGPGADRPAAPFAGTTGRLGRWLAQAGWRHLVGLAFLAFALFPIVFVLSAALNPAGTLSSTTLIPHSASWSNFHHLLTDPGAPFLSWMLNTLWIAGGAALCTNLISFSAAFAFSRLRFRGRKNGLLGIVLIQMFPTFIAVTALYLMFTSIGNVYAFLAPGRYSLFLVYLGGSLGVNTWLMKGYIDTVPRELDEAATIDGASHAQIFFGIVMRLSLPILIVTLIIGFVGLINDFIFANLFLTSGSQKTLLVGLYGLINGEPNGNYGEFAAGALIAGVPVVVLFLIGQRWLVGGLTSGAVKS